MTTPLADSLLPSIAGAGSFATYPVPNFTSPSCNLTNFAGFPIARSSVASLTQSSNSISTFAMADNNPVIACDIQTVSGHSVNIIFNENPLLLDSSSDLNVSSVCQATCNSTPRVSTAVKSAESELNISLIIKSYRHFLFGDSFSERIIKDIKALAFIRLATNIMLGASALFYAERFFGWDWDITIPFIIGPIALFNIARFIKRTYFPSDKALKKGLENAERFLKKKIVRATKKNIKTWLGIIGTSANIITQRGMMSANEWAERFLNRGLSVPDHKTGKSHNLVAGMTREQVAPFVRLVQKSPTGTMILAEIARYNEHARSRSVLSDVKINWKKKDLDNDDIVEAVVWLDQMGNSSAVEWVLEHARKGDEKASQIMMELSRRLGIGDYRDRVRIAANIDADATSEEPNDSKDEEDLIALEALEQEFEDEEGAVEPRRVPRDS